jgi:C4-dicarboxylate-specific signal transduction histidine kinase
MGEITTSLAHELNQPLSAIMSNAHAGIRFLAVGKGDPKTLGEILTDVVADGRRASDIIATTRNAIKKATAIRSQIDLNNLVTAVTRMVHGDAAAHSCELHLVLAEDLPAIEADPVQIQQVLVNLITNAFDAMRDTPVANRKVEIRTERNGAGMLRISVRDHGSGLRPGADEQVFEQFFTTKSDGLGMGLAIARSLIESHGGRIAAENAAGGGACFRFELPANPPPTV